MFVKPFEILSAIELQIIIIKWDIWEGKREWSDCSKFQDTAIIYCVTLGIWQVLSPSKADNKAEVWNLLIKLVKL